MELYQKKLTGVSKGEAFAAVVVSIIAFAPIGLMLYEPKPIVTISEKQIFQYLDEIKKPTQPSLLRDPHNLISDDFQVQPDIYPAVLFWYEIYTKYSSLQAIYHHSDYPWIVLGIYDAEPVLKRTGSVFQARFDLEKKSPKFKRDLKHQLSRLSKMDNYENLSADDQILYNKLKNIPGERSKVFEEARKKLRTQIGQMDHFLMALNRSHLIIEEIEQVFVQQGLPIELSRIPFLESSFNNNVYSKVGAAGIWQLMPRTAKQYIKVDREVDERLDQLKATQAAAEVLKTYYQSLNDWPLAVSAYNQGIGTIQNAILIQGSRDIAQILNNHKSRRFRFASSSYYPCFLAAIHAYAYKDQIFGVEFQPMSQ